MFERSPIPYSVVRYASIFNPKEMIFVDAELLQSKMKKFYSILINWVSWIIFLVTNPIINLFTLFKMRLL